jgi:hypothetical protein
LTTLAFIAGVDAGEEDIGADDESSIEPNETWEPGKARAD